VIAVDAIDGTAIASAVKKANAAGILGALENAPLEPTAATTSPPLSQSSSLLCLLGSAPNSRSAQTGQ
jgi:hypothetical protein